VRDGGVADGRGEAREQPRPLEQLAGQRARAAVVGAEQAQPAARVRRRHALHHVEVVVHDQRVQRLARDVHQARVRHAQQEQHRELPLLVVQRTGDARQGVLVERQARDDDDGARREPVLEDALHEPWQPALQAREFRKLLRRAWLERRRHPAIPLLSPTPV
jgi:hypothetical protein